MHTDGRDGQGATGRPVIADEGWRSVAELVRQRMDQLDLTPAEIADRSPAAARTLRRILSPRPTPVSMRSLRALSETLDLDVTELVWRLAHPDE